MKGRQGRANASREDTINNVIERERELYNTCGIGKLYLYQLHPEMVLMISITKCPHW